MEYGTNIIKDGLIIRTSKNLRSMRDYARVSPVALLETHKDKNGWGILTVCYADGARSRAHFRSHPIMIDWVRNRRTWRNAVVVHHDGDVGYLTKPGIIAGQDKAKSCPASGLSDALADRATL